MVPQILSVLLLVAMFFHVWNSPFSKVEESFNIQAMHDVLYHRDNISYYDHLQFPGVVPRSFLGPIIIAGLAYPITEALKIFQLPKIYAQIICRVILGMLVCASLLKFQRSVSHRSNQNIAKLMTILTISQFHFLYYASRTLPNTFALILVLYAVASWLSHDHKSFIWSAAFAIIIFRSELCVFMGLLLLVKLVRKEISFSGLLVQCMLAGPSALALTVLVDSYFWQRWLWPEGEVLYFNTLLNKSSNWGVSFQTLPFFWYFYSAIPRVLLFSLPFLPLGLCTRRYKDFVLLFVSALCYILVYSFLPHKELRFIIYVFPILNLAIAVALSEISQFLRSYEKLKKCFYVVIIGVIMANLSATALFTYVSRRNYAGGEAFGMLHELNSKHDQVYVHIGNAAAQTGVTRFGELFTGWRYSKDENFSYPKWLNTNDVPFTHVIVESPCSNSNGYHVQARVDGFKKLEFKSIFPFLRVIEEVQLCILKLKI